MTEFLLSYLAVVAATVIGYLIVDALLRRRGAPPKP